MSELNQDLFESDTIFELPPKKPYLSWSRIETFLKCGEQFRRRYIEREIIPPGFALVAGSGAHRSVECNLRQKHDTGKLMSEEQIETLAREEVDRIVDEKGIRLFGKEKDLGKIAVVDEAKNRAMTLGLVHSKAVAPNLNIAYVEHEFRVVLNNYPFDIVGVVDVIEKPEPNSTVGMFRDTKTSSTKKQMADTSDQLTLYGFWGKQKFGAMPPLAIDLLVATKTPQYECQRTYRRDDDVKTLARRVETIVDAFRKGVFLPAKQDDWWCSQKFCGYADTCPYFRKKVVVSVGDLS